MEVAGCDNSQEDFFKIGPFDLVLKHLRPTFKPILLIGRLKGNPRLAKLVEALVVSFSDAGEEPAISTITYPDPKRSGFVVR